MRRLFAIPVVAAALAACTALQNPQTAANVQQALAVGCLVDGVVQPIAQPVLSTLGGPAGASVATADALLVHPAVVAVCATLKGVPVVAPAAAAPVVAPAVAAAPVAAAPVVAAPVAAPVTTVKSIVPATVTAH